MAKTPDFLEPLIAKVVDVKGRCNAGHTKGDDFLISCYDNGGLCGFFFHDIFPKLSVMQFGGRYPWGETNSLTMECPDRINRVTLLVIRRGKDCEE